MAHLAIQMLRNRLTALVAVVCAVLGGAAMITGTAVLAESGLRSHLPAGRLSGTDLVVSADQSYRVPEDMPIALPERATVPAALVDRLAQLPGVLSAVGDVSFPAALIGPGDRPVPSGDPQAAGHGWSSTLLLQHPQIDGRAPSGPGEVAVDSTTAAAAGVRPGDRVQAMVAGRPATYRLSAVVAAPGAGILFADPTAVQLAGREHGPRASRVDLVGLQVRPGAADAVSAAIPHELDGHRLSVATGGSRGDSAAPGTVAARSLLVLLAGSLAGILLLIIGFVVAGALAVSIGGQRRELALLRAVGATPRQIRRLAASQATLVATAALVPGVGLGYLLAGQFRRMLVSLGMIPEALPLSISPMPAIGAAVLLLLVVQVSARSAAWRTSRLPATEAVTESRSEPRNPSRVRTFVGFLLIVAATTLSTAPLLTRSLMGAAATSLAGIIAAIGLAMAGPALVARASEALARHLPAGLSAPTWLAVANIRGYALRLSGVVSTLAMAVVFILTYTVSQTTLMTAVSRDVRAGTLAQQSIGAPGTGGLPDTTLAAVRATPGVRAAAPLSTTTVLWPFQSLGDLQVEANPALILTPDAATILDLDVRAGSLGKLTGSTVAVGGDVARSRHAGLGRQVSLILGDGTRTTATVVAVYGRSLGFGPIVISQDLAAGHTTSGLDQSILVRTDGTATAEQNLTALVASRPALTLQDTAAGPGGPGGLSAAPPEVWINLATIAVLLGYLLLSIANKLVATTAQRRTEIATLRLNGTTPRQIRMMMRREAAVIAVAALASGLALSTIPLALLGIGFLDHPWPAGPVWLLPATAVTIIAIAFITIELPTRQALRLAPAHALSLRE